VPDRPELLTRVRGQVEVATTDGVIAAITLDPPDPPLAPAVLAAVEAADWVVLGPGSWFTSVIPHLMILELRQALVATSAHVVVVLNLTEQVGETPGFGPSDHLAVLLEHAPDLQVHTVLVDRASAGADLDELAATVGAHGARLVVDDIAEAPGSARHDPRLLAAAYARIFASVQAPEQA
jgi:uncharacterized cofD-like protein